MEKLIPPENFDFPFAPYDIQHDFMTNLYKVLEEGQLGIFESPTGTGKSLSIICGAVRWLKDHNQRIRDSLRSKIEQLEVEKRECQKDSSDWLSTQASEIEIVHKINDLRLEKTKIDLYDQKIGKILSKTQKNEKKNKFKQVTKLDVVNIDDSITPSDKTVQDDDILLDEESSECVDLEDSEDDEDEDSDQKFKPIKIYICSRTHSQLAQLVGEITKSPYAEDIRVTSLASRQNYCINPEVNRLRNVSLINERCLDLQKSKNNKTKNSEGPVSKKSKKAETKCPYFKQNLIEDLRDSALCQVQDVEDLVSSGRNFKACPYYGSRLASEDAEIILVPYNTLLHKATREANGINVKNNIVIIDEAHNLLEAMARMHSSEVNLQQLELTLKQLKSYKNRFSTRFSPGNLLMINQLIFVVGQLVNYLSSGEKSGVFSLEHFVVTTQIDNYNMFKLIKFCKDSRLAQKVRGCSMKYPPETSTKKLGVKDFLKSIENNSTKPPEETEVVVTELVSTPILPVISFLESLTYSCSDGRIFVAKSPDDKRQSKLQFLLLNPSKNFEQIVKDARAVVVAGGTLKPMSEFRGRLFLNSGADPGRIFEFSCDHIIPKENIRPIVVTKGPKSEPLLFTFDKRLSMGETLKSVILEACDKVRGGIVVFFSSYSYENWVFSQIKDLKLNRAVFREPQNSGSVEMVLKRYSDVICARNSRGALLLSVIGGKLSEGLNFSDDLGRCIIVVGLPYANINAPDLKEKMSYLDQNEGSGSGQKFYENLCMKAVNQSIGRAVRHKDDYATILLLDERYNRPTVKNALPDWIKRSLIVGDFRSAFESIEEFFKSRK